MTCGCGTSLGLRTLAGANQGRVRQTLSRPSNSPSMSALTSPESVLRGEFADGGGGGLPVRREQRLQGVDLGHVVDRNVGLIRMLCQVILMVGFRRIEWTRGIDPGDDRAAERVGC